MQCTLPVPYLYTAVTSSDPTTKTVFMPSFPKANIRVAGPVVEGPVVAGPVVTETSLCTVHYMCIVH